MLYGEYTEDWRFSDRATLSTQVYPGKSHLSQPKQQQQQQQQQGSPHLTHTRFSILKTSLLPPTQTPAFLTPWKCFFSQFYIKSIIKEYGVHKVVRYSVPALFSPFLHNPNKTESGYVDFPFQTDFLYPHASESISVHLLKKINLEEHTPRPPWLLCAIHPFTSTPQNSKSCMKPCTHTHSSIPQPPRWCLCNFVTLSHL